MLLLACGLPFKNYVLDSGMLKNGFSKLPSSKSSHNTILAIKLYREVDKGFPLQVKPKPFHKNVFYTIPVLNANSRLVGQQQYL